VTDDLAGGYWEREARTLRVATDGWIRGHYVPTAIHGVGNYARLADTLQTRAALHQLHQALATLEVEIEKYRKRLDAFRHEVGILHALVLRAREEAPDKSPEQLEGERHARLVDQSDPGPVGDDVLRRIAGYYAP